MIEIYDANNKERLLGSIRKPFEKLNALDYRMQVCAATSFRTMADLYDEPVVLDIVEFRIGWRTSEDGWTRNAVFTTYTKLEDLLNLRDFRLPGETEAQVQYRWYAK